MSATPKPGASTTPLVFVHGAWHGLWCWEEHFLPFFVQAGYSVHAFDLRGHGQSENSRPLRLTRIDDYVADLERVIEDLGVEPVLVGHSMGGLVVQRYLEGRSLPGAILLASVPVGGTLRATLRVGRRFPLALARANLSLSLWPLVSTRERAGALLFAPDTPAEDLSRCWPRLQDESFTAFVQMIFRRPRPSRVRTPVLVIGGDADGLFGVRETEATAKAYGGEAVIVPGAGHNLMLDGRWREVAETMLTWLGARGIGPTDGQHDSA